MFTGLYQVLLAVWLGTGRFVGGLARKVGRHDDAPALDPMLRRDGLGLLFVGLALLVAAGVWWQVDGAVGEGVRGVVVGGVGRTAWLVPVGLLAIAWRVLRNPAHNAPLGRLVIGWVAIVLGLTGMVHVTHGTPQFTDGATLMEEGGGWLGFVGAAPLTAAVTGVVAFPLLMLLLGFGVLVVTGTPIHQIPERVTGLLDRVLNRPAPDSAVVDVTDEATSARRRRTSRGDDPLAADQPFDNALVTAEGTTKWRRGAGTPVVDTGGSPATGSTSPPPSRHPRTARSPPTPTLRRCRPSRSRAASSSSRSPATSPTTCRSPTLSTPAPRTRRAPRPTTWSSRR